MFTFGGKIRRRQYLLSGLVLAVIKYSIDSFVAARFGESWKAHDRSRVKTPGYSFHRSKMVTETDL